MYISAFPTLTIKTLFNPFPQRSWDRHFPFQKPIFFYRGANAVWSAVKILKLPPQSHVLVPAYHCGVEISAVLKAGGFIQFYNIKNDLLVDLEDIQRKINHETKAILVIHYFGFPQPIREIKRLCDSKKIFLIEDCAHALFGRIPEGMLGSFGDASIFSFQKSLPVADGGAMILKKEKLEESRMLRQPPGLTVLRGLSVLWMEHLKMFHQTVYQFLEGFIFNPLRYLLKQLKKIPTESFQIKTASTHEFDEGLTVLGMSNVSLKISQNIDPDLVIQKRRKNFQFLKEGLKNVKGIAFLYHDLAEGICPLFFPILADDRNFLQERLNQKSIGTFIFGKILHPHLPREKFPSAEFVSNKNLCFPIHQDLDEIHLKYMIEAITE